MTDAELLLLLIAGALAALLLLVAAVGLLAGCVSPAPLSADPDTAAKYQRRYWQS